ncbi:putative PEP-binding protein [uncultured Gemmiger sp.]|uniref:putative PEP-binding protein n=1 Tax=uncultured Gemmiger sp. TaxID=1623490 RepID=UPI0025EA262E|nr:putative PEP-binding protein [uncultured Gemmiger sp.]
MPVLKGIKVSPGVAVGPVVRLDRGIVGLHRIVSDPFRERALYEAAIVLAKDELRRLRQHAQGADADILMFQIALLEDESFTNEIGDYIAAGAGSAAAVERAEKIFAARLNNVDNDYIRQRSVDVRDACRRVVDILDGRPRQQVQLTQPSILAADLFFPSDIFAIDRSMILGLAADADSDTSHAAIMARTMGIPAVFRLGKGVTAELTGHEVLLDGLSCTVIPDPTPDEIVAANHRLALFERRNNKKHALAGKPCFTRDGTRVTLLASASTPEDIENAMHAGADAIGLVRTEHLLLGHATEAQQYFHYISCLAAAAGKSVTVRTGDVGADDAAPWVEDVRRAAENRRQLRTQITALLRAGTRGNLRVMLPMITGPEEWDDVMREVARCKEHLERRGVEYDKDLPFGCLIEIPSAALVADQIIDRGAKFLAIDIDDLTRYTLAANTREEARSHMAADAPALRRLVNLVCQMARERGVPVYMCGVKTNALPAMGTYLRDGVHAFCMEATILNDLKGRFMEMDLAQTPDPAAKALPVAAMPQ